MRSRSCWRTHWQRGWATIDSQFDMTAKPHLTKWTVVTAIKIRRFATLAEAEAERDKTVERGERAYIIAPLEAWGGGVLILVHREFPGRSGGQAPSSADARASAYERVYWRLDCGNLSSRWRIGL